MASGSCVRGFRISASGTNAGRGTLSPPRSPPVRTRRTPGAAVRPNVDGYEPGVGMDAADEGRVELAGQVDIVHVPAAPSKEPLVLDAPHTRPDEAIGGGLAHRTLSEVNSSPVAMSAVGTATPSTCSAARTMFRYPVHRHRCPATASTIPPVRISGSPARLASDIMIPGVQKPHWSPCSSLNAWGSPSASHRLS